MKNCRLFFLMIAAFVFAAILGGCMTSQSSVRLLYNSQTAAAPSNTAAPRIAVVHFEDARVRPDLGVRKDGSSFETVSSVSEWVTQSLADELSRRGFLVSVAFDAEQAAAGHPDRIIVGTVDEVWLKEKSINSYEAVIRVQARIEGNSEPAQTRKFISSQEKSGIPGVRLAEETLSTTLSDVLDNFCRSVSDTVR